MGVLSRGVRTRDYWNKDFLIYLISQIVEGFIKRGKTPKAGKFGSVPGLGLPRFDEPAIGGEHHKRLAWIG
jgi:hypothetical protein